jgi:hypothetical protein
MSSSSISSSREARGIITHEDDAGGGNSLREDSSCYSTAGRNDATILSGQNTGLDHDRRGAVAG